jgi:hypothetical protein
MGRKIDLTGKTFGRLTVLKEAGRSNHKKVLWVCVCEDGNKVVVAGCNLRRGNTKSCGCLSRELSAERFLNHGQTVGGKRTPEYAAWIDAKRRCNNTNNAAYHNYGGRDIKVLFSSFSDFFEELGPRPSPEHSIDRINNDGQYEPGNVRWATRVQQNNNRRRRRPTK